MPPSLHSRIRSLVTLPALPALPILPALTALFALTLFTPTLAPAQTSDPASRLINFSVRARAGAGAQTFAVGVTVTGTGDTPTLLRVIGPSLAAFGLSNVLANPSLQLFAGPTIQRANDDWAVDFGNGTSLLASHQNAFALTGAFPLDPTSKDAALIRAMNPRDATYTLQVGGTATPGLALVELYDLFLSSGARLSNLSARAQVGPGADALIAGFVVGGTTPKRLLLRAVGPALVPLNVTGVLANPKLDLYRGPTVIDQNDDWAGAPVLVNAFSTTGAFALPSATSRDAALLVTLAPGAYTAVVTGTGSETGIALIEIYEVP